MIDFSKKITFPTSPVNSHACLVLIILIFQLIETIVLMPEMTTINEMVLVTDLHPDEVMGKYLITSEPSLSVEA